jgi:hypothetical protein
MKHASTRAVHAYWNDRRGARAAPCRNDIDPVAIRAALGDTFLLSADFVDQLRFRLAGTRVCALFCRELKGEILAALWGDNSRKAIDDILAVVTDESEGMVTGLTGRAEDGAEIDLEMLLLPLARSAQTRTSVLGVLAPVTPVYWLGAKPVVDMTLGTLRHLSSEAASTMAPRFPAPADGSQMRHGFTVYSGGLAQPPNDIAS